LWRTGRFKTFAEVVFAPFSYEEGRETKSPIDYSDNAPTSLSDDERGLCPVFRDIKTLQKFTSTHASIHNHFSHDRHLSRRA
jgi:hypothetical protein